MKQTKIYNLQHDFVFVFEANSDFPSVFIEFSHNERFRIYLWI